MISAQVILKDSIPVSRQDREQNHASLLLLFRDEVFNSLTFFDTIVGVGFTCPLALHGALRSLNEETRAHDLSDRTTSRPNS